MNSKNKPAHVSIIILNWNGWQDTIECLESALNLNYAKFNIILIDNNSTDDSVERISNWLTGKIEEHITTNFPRLIEPYTKKPVAFKIADLSDWKKLQLSRDINLLFLKSEKNSYSSIFRLFYCRR